MSWTRKHLITLEELSLTEIDQIHATAVAFKRTLSRSVKKVIGKSCSLCSSAAAIVVTKSCAGPPPVFAAEA